MVRALLSALLFAILGLVLPPDALAQQTVDVGPEDGTFCCSGLAPFLFQGDDVLVVTGRAGVMRLNRQTDRWQRSMDGLVASNGVSPFVGFVCQSPSTPGVVYALAGIDVPVSPFNGLFSSTDFGRHWTRRAAMDTGNGLNICAVDAADPATVYISGFVSAPPFTARTWRSSDGGRTVQDIGPLLPACAVGGLLATVRGAVYLGNLGCLAVSTDQGASFHPLTPPGTNAGGLAVSPDGGTIFQEEHDAALNYLGAFRSSDWGASWAPVSGFTLGYDIPLAFDPSDPSRIYAADGVRAYVSLDGGASFGPLPGDPRFLGSTPETIVGADSQGALYVIGFAGPGPFRSTDGGQTYVPVMDEFRASAVQDLAFDANGNLLVGVLHTQAVFRQGQSGNYTPLGRALINPNGPPGISVNAAAVAGSPVDPNVVLVATASDFGLARTTDGGQTWNRSRVAGNPDGFASSRMRFATATRVYLAAPNQQAPGLYRSDDGGLTFARPSRAPFGAIAVQSGDPDILYLGPFGRKGRLVKSTDGGQTLQPLGAFGDFSAIAIDRSNPGVLYVGESGGRVIRSVDGGQTFATASTGLRGMGVLDLGQDASGTLFAWIRGGGLFASHDGATTWSPVDSTEALLRSGVEAGRGTLAVDPRQPGRVYLGNAGVIKVDN